MLAHPLLLGLLIAPPNKSTWGRAPKGPLLLGLLIAPPNKSTWGRAPKGPYQSSPLKGPIFFRGHSLFIW
jgi:hypothetical protein